MTKIISLITLIIVSIFSISCANKKYNDNLEIVKVGFVGESDYQIWTPLIEPLKEKGIKIELVSFSDYIIPNQALNDGEIDLNAFQHHAFFDNEVKNKGYTIEAIADTYISSMNIYSKNITNIDQIKEKDKVAIPNDPSNGGRALKVLEASGLIKTDPNKGDSPTISDIIENKFKLEIVEVDAGSILSLLPDVSCAVINGNYAVDFGFNPNSDYIFKDDPSIYVGNAFVNLIAVRRDEKDKEVYKKIIETYQSEIVENVLINYFNGAYIPTWNK